MRITDSILQRAFLNQFDDTRSRVAQHVERIASGQKVNRPSDNPSSYSLGQQEQARLAEVEMHRANIAAGQNHLGTADGVLQEISGMLTRAREIGVQMASGVPLPIERQVAAVEIESLRTEIDRLVNVTRIGDDPIFVNDGEERLVDVGRGVQVEITVNRRRLLNDTVDTLQVMADLATALRTDNIPGIIAQLDPLTSAHDQVANGHGETGAKWQELRIAARVADSVEDNARNAQSVYLHTDLAKEATDLNATQAVLQAALRAGARALGNTLANLL